MGRDRRCSHCRLVLSRQSLVTRTSLAVFGGARLRLLVP